MHISDVDGDRTVRISPRNVNSTTEGYCRYLLPIPLNRDVTLEFYSVSLSVKYRKIEHARIDSHFSYWVWATEDQSTDAQTEFESAILMINADKPPAQTRSFQSPVQLTSPTGRSWPVAFSDFGLTGDMSVTGVALDNSGGVEHSSSVSIPNAATIASLGKLARLAGKGIHPIYRTPYGDWYHVAISEVKLDKQELGYVTVTVTQKIVED
jgi:hypothetical protein